MDPLICLEQGSNGAHSSYVSRANHIPKSIATACGSFEPFLLGFYICVIGWLWLWTPQGVGEQVVQPLFLKFVGSQSSGSNKDEMRGPDDVRKRKDIFISHKKIARWQAKPVHKVHKFLRQTPQEPPEEIIQQRLQNQTNPSQWKTNVVLVPAVYDEWAKYGVPYWARLKDYQLFLYQRKNPQKKNYAYNFGYEAGIYLRFIVDHYYDLPVHTAFVHARPQQHNRRWLEWLKCIRPELNYSILNNQYVKYRPLHSVGQADKEQCWRDMLSVGGHPLPPKLEPAVGFYCCNQFVISKRQLLRHSLETYERLLRMMGAPPDVCHEGPFDKDALYMNTTETTESPGPASSKMAGSTFEHLQHVVMGGHPMLMPETPSTSTCRNFLPDHECNGSPCRTAEGKKKTRGCWQGKVFLCK
uniref:Uncharacterized protein n=1 Tax=Eutreptiella gymnastica TaxID=73025 RepID=A0A7S1J8S5_9EUGL|mmetsp:Transcript_76532/g.135143  ORF Transcript_76532/g.135143 Transcript_76532/m.135143 type:complete len:413 (+) Transcript_76532:87-1325(+)